MRRSLIFGIVDLVVARREDISHVRLGSVERHAIQLKLSIQKNLCNKVYSQQVMYNWTPEQRSHRRVYSPVRKMLCDRLIGIGDNITTLFPST
jgi:hypothetical protein